MRLNHNPMAFTAANNYSTINRNLTASMERLSSGYKINKSSDDPTGKAISQRMNAQLRGISRATSNANDGISLIQTAEGALNEIHSILARMRELSVQAANPTFDVTDCDAMQAEITQLQEELDRISETTQFNGRTLLNGELNRKGYTDSKNVSIAEIGGNVDAGEYKLSIDAVGATAMVTTTAVTADYTGESGSIVVNGLSISVPTGATATEIQEAIRDYADRIGIDYDIAAGTFETREKGSDQKLLIDATNDDLRTLLGLPQEDYGTDAKASFGT